MWHFSLDTNSIHHLADVGNISGGVRPSIALKSTTNILGGNGTASNPYIVN